MRKSTAVKKEAEKIVEKLREIEILAREAELEEKAVIEDINNAITELCKKDNLFCGVVLTPEDIINVFRTALESKENVKIPFHLYYNE